MAKTGRPPKYKTAAELQKLIDAYFERCEREYEPLTITGLGLAINLSRQQIIEYGKRDIFHDMIKRAKLKVEHDYELALRKKGRAGDIFGLKNFGWRDKTEQDIHISGIEETLKNL